MNPCVRLVGFSTVMVAGLTLAGEPKSSLPTRGKRPATPREANALRLALSQQEEQRQQTLLQQALQLQASEQQAFQKEALRQLALQTAGRQAWQPHLLRQDQAALEGLGAGFSSHAFPRNGAFVYDGRGPTLGGAMPMRGAYIYDRSVAPTGSAIPRNGAYSYQGSGGSIPKNGAFFYQNGR